MSVKCRPQLIWIVKPENKYRFRYASEGGSHGGISGKDGKKSFPTLELKNYSGKKKILVRVTLYTEDHKEHVLDFKGEKNEGSKRYIEKELQSDNTVVFNNLQILCKKKEEIERVLMERKIRNLKEGVTAVARAELEKMYISDVKVRAKAIQNSARLYFEAFEVDRPDARLCTLFSDVINNQKTASKGDLRIVRLSQCSGSWKGDDEIILLCEKVQKENIKVKFFETEDGEKDGEVVWEAYGRFSPVDVHYQVAIPFKTPRYKQINQEMRVFICLERNGEMSDPREFVYKPDGKDLLFLEPPVKKRKTPFSDDSENSNLLFSQHAPPEFDLLLSQHSAPESAESNSSMSISSPESGANAAVGEMSSSSSLPCDELLKEDDEMLIDFLCDLTKNSEDDFLSQLADLNSGDCALPFEELYNDVPFDGVAINTEQNQNLIPETFDIDSRIYQDIDINAALVNLTIKTEDEMEYHTQKKCAKNEFVKLKSSVGDLQQKNLICSKRLLKKNSCGNTLLHIAVILKKNIFPMLKIIHDMKIDLINSQNDKNQTALHLACEENMCETVKILLKCGSNPNLKDFYGNTCYHIAARNNFPCILAEINRSSRFHPEVNIFNDEGLTPMHLAIMRKNPVLFDLLKRHMSDYNIADKKAGRSLLHYATEFLPSLLPKLLEMPNIDVNITDFERNTPLHIACANENIEAVKKLLQYGADPFMKNVKQNFNILDVENSKYDASDGQLPADLTSNIEILKLLNTASNSPAEDLQKQNSASFKESHEKQSEIIQRLCKYLDQEMRWKKLVTFFLDDDALEGLTLSSSPAKALLNYVKRREKEKYLERFKTALEFADLNDGVNILNEINVVNE